jgi:hypothetical protein
MGEVVGLWGDFWILGVRERKGKEKGKGERYVLFSSSSFIPRRLALYQFIAGP